MADSGEQPVFGKDQPNTKPLAETEWDAAKEFHDSKCVMCSRTENTAGPLHKAHLKTHSLGDAQVLPMCSNCQTKFDEGLFTDAQLKDFASNPQAFARKIAAARDHLQAVRALDATGAIDVYKARVEGVTPDELRAVTNVTAAELAKIDPELEHLLQLDTGGWISRKDYVFLESEEWIPRSTSDIMEGLRKQGAADPFGNIDLYKARAAGITPTRLQQLTGLTAADIDKVDAEFADLVQTKNGDWISGKDYETVRQQASAEDLHVLDHEGVDAYNRVVVGKGLEGIPSYRQIVAYKPTAPEPRTWVTQTLPVVQLFGTGQG